MRIAITREVSPAFNQCELTHLERQPIDLDLARAQHRQYEQALRNLGCEVHPLPAEPHLPDSVFVEDVAIVLDEVAIITRPGAESRRGECESIARALAPYRPLAFIEPPGTIDGGDVLRVDRRLYAGVSSRSNSSAIEQLRHYLTPFGYTVVDVPVKGCLHLKSAVTQVSPDMVLINPAWVDRAHFVDLKFVEVDPAEPSAANAVWIGDRVIYPSGFPGTYRRLLDHGITVELVDASEAAKAEGAVTCCSVIFHAAVGCSTHDQRISGTIASS